MFQNLSFGAVGAALIAAAISMVGLIISKEQKVSDFRQAWIDSLRQEITSYLTSINAISDAVSVIYKDHAEKVNSLSKLYASLNQAHFSIILRLNARERKSKDVLDCLNRFYELAQDEKKMVASELRPIEKEFLRASKELLKYEWKRVKRGEPAFYIAKVFAMIVVVSVLAELAHTSWSPEEPVPATSKISPSLN